MSKCKIHNVRFYRPKPNAVYCMALQANTNKLAISRSDASVEIWNLLNAPFIERTISSSTDNFSVEGLAWCGDRLFSVGLHGLLIEYDLYKLSIKDRAAVTGEAAFCLDVDGTGTQIAIGTEQGYVNIFEVHSDEFLFQKLLDKQEGRILCLKYDHSGEYVVSGSMDAIRIWSISSGHALHKMLVGRSEANKPTIVWCLAVTKDFTVISGDSRGKLTFWDGKVGSQLESYQSHQADILAMCLSQDEQSLYCAGIDPNIVNYVGIKVKDGFQRWVRSIQRKLHDHDVRALVLCTNKLYSSGVDGYLACSYYPPKTLLKFPPILQNPCVALSPQARLILLRYPKYVEVWSLGEADDSKEKQNSLLSLKSEPKKLLVLQKVVKNDDGEPENEGIICSTISGDGKWIIFSTRLGMRLFQFSYTGESRPELVPVEILEEDAKIPCNSAIFLTNTLLAVAPNLGGLKIFSLSPEIPLVFQTINTQTELTDTISLLTSSSCGNYVVAADLQSNICVWSSKKKQYNFYCKLPKYKVPPTAVSVHPTALTVVVTYADNNMIEYDLKKRQLTKFSRTLTKNLTKQWFSRTNAIRNITFDTRDLNIIILHDDSSIIVINKEKKVPTTDVKIPKIDFTQIDGNAKHGFPSNENAFHYIKKYKHLVHLSWLANDELVAVEVNSLSLIEQLPPCLIQSTFGRK